MKTAPASQSLPDQAIRRLPSATMDGSPRPGPALATGIGRAPRRIPPGLKIAYTLFMAVLVPVYWSNYGLTNFLYFCDVALFLTLAGIWAENRLLLSLAAVGILVPQALWVVDFAAHLVGFKLTGMTDYMFDSQRSLFLRGLSLFHGWLPFLLVFLVARVGYDRRAWPGWTTIAWALCLVCYFWMPPAGAVLADPKLPVNINYVHGFDDARPQSWLPAPAYLAAWMAVLAAAVYAPTHWVLNRLFGAHGANHPALSPGVGTASSSPAPSRAGSFQETLLRSLSTLLVMSLALISQAGQPDTTGSGSDADSCDVREAGFKAPACAIWDAEADTYLVANTNGDPLAADDNGFISRVRPDGTVAELRWIDGANPGVMLHAPKGMAIVGESLWVADIDVVRRFHRVTGEPTGEIIVVGASCLTAVTTDAEGRLLITDAGRSREGGAGLTPGGAPGLLVIDTQSGEVSAHSMTRLAGEFSRFRLAWSAGPLNKPAIAELDRCFRGDAPYGQPGAAAFLGTGYALVAWDTGRFHVLAGHEGGGITEVFQLPAGMLSGLLEVSAERERYDTPPARRGAGRCFLVSSWEAGCVYEITTGTDPSVTVLVSGLRSPSGLGYDACRNRVLVPLYLDDALAIRSGPSWAAE